MEKLYAQAIWKAIEGGHDHKKAVDTMAKILKRQGRMELMPRIAKAFARLAEADRKKRPRIVVARKGDAAHALKASGVAKAEVHVDESIIGGWRLEGGSEIIDRSFKKYLLDIYTSSIAA